MTDITQEMQKLIADNLPAATAGEMSKFIEEANATKEKLDTAEDRIKVQNKELEASKKEIEILKRQIEYAGDLGKKKEQLSKDTEALNIRERDISLEVMQVELQSANDRNATVERLVDKVFGHPSVTVSTYKDVMVPVEGGSGCSGYAHKEHGVTESQTTTQSKS